MWPWSGKLWDSPSVSEALSSVIYRLPGSFCFACLSAASDRGWQDGSSAAMPEDLSLVPGCCMVEEKNQLSSCPLTSTRVYLWSLNTHMCNPRVGEEGERRRGSSARSQSKHMSCLRSEAGVFAPIIAALSTNKECCSYQLCTGLFPPVTGIPLLGQQNDGRFI